MVPFPRRFALFLCLFAAPLVADTFTVTNAADSGAGSLRQAILDANGHAGADTIAFAIGSGPATITLASALPDITEAVTIDGSTQPGFAGAPLVRIDMNHISSPAIVVVADGCVIRRLVLNRFGQSGAAIQLTGNGNTVAGNFIGTDATGTQSAEGALTSYQALGISINGSNNTIGGTDPTDRNIISGCGTGILIRPSASSNHVIGNFIGTDVTGTASIGNAGHGCRVEGGSGSGNVIGGVTAAERNVISANDSGIFLYDPAVTILGNYIGTDLTGRNAIPNRVGIWIWPQSDGPTSGHPVIGGAAFGAGNLISGNSQVGINIESSLVTVLGNRIGITVDGAPLGNGGPVFAAGILISGNGNIIGGTGAGEGNVIANTGGDGYGLKVLGFFGTNGNRFRGNSMFGNAIGIDLNADGPTANDAADADEGPNHLQNFPIVTAVAVNGGTMTIDATLDTAPLGTYSLDFFANTACGKTGYGEGETYLGSTAVATDANGHAAVHVSFPASGAAMPFVAATATSATGETSEFSPCFASGGQVHFSSAFPQASEGGAAILTVVRDNAAAQASISYATADGTAHAGSDYVAASGQLNFAPGETTKTITVPILDDSLYDPAETFTVSLSAPSAGMALVNPSTLTVMIGDDDPPSGPTLTVTNTNDSGPGSLRQAILDANARPGFDIIGFAIGSGPQTISVLSALPQITDPVAIDGTTQPGYAGKPIIEVSGFATSTTQADAFVITAGRSVIRGLVINRFSYEIQLLDNGGNLIAGNVLGLNRTGDAAASAFYAPSQPNPTFTFEQLGAIVIRNSAGNRIGGAAPADRNVIAAHERGIEDLDSIRDRSSGTVVEGNYFGTDVTGLNAILLDSPMNLVSPAVTIRNNLVGAAGVGLYVQGPGGVVQGNTFGLDATGHGALPIRFEAISVRGNGILIGGTTAQTRNVIAASQNGIWVDNGTADVTISGNYIGTDVTGLRAVPNVSDGIVVPYQFGGPSAQRLTIGGTAPGAGNLISGNSFEGIFLGSTADTKILGNQIGVAADGSALPNHDYGVYVANPAFHTEVGDVAAGAGNVITHNLSGGVLSLSENTTVRGNSAFPNAFGFSAGISPGSINVTSAIAAGGQTVIDGDVLGGEVGEIIDLYRNPANTPDMTEYVGATTLVAGVPRPRFHFVINGELTGSVALTDTNVARHHTSQVFAGGPISHPGTFQISPASARVSEGAGTFDLTVTRTGGSDGAVTVTFAVTPATATPGADYTAPATTTLSFAAGESVKTITIPILQDTVSEFDEFFTVALTSVSAPAALGAVKTATITIVDDDAPLVRMSAAAVVEGNSGTTPVAVEITLSNPSSATVRVRYATQPQTALEGEDFVPAAGILEFAPGETHKSIVLQVIGDTKPEHNERFDLTLPDATNAVISTPRVGIDILDDDAFYRSITGLEYRRVDGISLLLDLYLPTTGDGPLPLVVFVGGSTWSDTPRFAEIPLRETERGYAVATIAYRRPDQARFPAQIADVKSAIRWLRKNAPQYGFDPNRIAIWGFAAGGHLASLAGVASEVRALDDPLDPNYDVSSRVIGVVDLYGPTDLASLATAPGCDDSLASAVSNLLGCSVAACPSTARDASPIHYVSADDPPFLIMHGGQSCQVPLAQSQVLYDALIAQKVPARFVIFGLEAEEPLFWQSEQPAANADAFLDAIFHGVAPKHRALR